MAALVEVNGSWRQLYYRSGEPIYEDPALDGISSLLRGRCVGVIHSRRSSRKELKGIGHTHPYHVRSGPAELFFAHNGSVLRKAFNEPDLPYTDSFLLLNELARWIPSLSPREALERLRDSFGPESTSLNSALLYHTLSSTELHVLNYYNLNRAKEEEEYYKLYRWEEYVASSSVAAWLEVGSPLGNGSVVSL
ncbi:hypothetical protein HS1genome_1370 [Sulfodiicoccus acidiphilus]|uniref:Glutamine amidotransferase type-2 domain-containing protein n=1 Tax=Sulfodiicoccus acidiphilus TaxID=1670455 RepID=A0A348B479_9CREN|nr:glutamine amidotransferase [Sulfodiicoccus acidiphilus]BBD72981.1 hypothetical protein HS1genome_1370 [Sulfodiicoccus acidiphilus]